MQRSHLIDLRPLTTSPAFARLWVGSTLAGMGGQLTIVALMLHMYALTGSSFAVAMIAVAGLIPMVLAGLYGGMLADAFDRRAVALIAASVAFLATALLVLVTWTGMVTPGWLYLIAIVTSAANSVVQATRSAMVPRLVTRELLPAAAALNGITVGIMVTVGPALAGVLVAFVGYGWTYTVDLVLMSALFLGLASLPRIRPEGEVVAPGWSSFVDSWRFLRRAANIRTQFLIDIAAMTFGQPLALFPAIGAVLLGGGPVTTGALTAAYAVGAFITSLFSGRVGQYRAQGVGIERSVQVYGAAISVFGAVLLAGALGVLAPPVVSVTSPNLGLIVAAAVMLAIAGGADNISAIYRSTMMQAAVPDAMRGRLQGLFIVVVAGGPRLGALYAGALATVTTLWFPPLLGGLLIIAMVAVLIRANPRFRAYDAADPQP